MPLEMSPSMASRTGIVRWGEVKGRKLRIIIKTRHVPVDHPITYITLLKWSLSWWKWVYYEMTVRSRDPLPTTVSRVSFVHVFSFFLPGTVRWIRILLNPTLKFVQFLLGITTTRARFNLKRTYWFKSAKKWSIVGSDDFRVFWQSATHIIRDSM